MANKLELTWYGKDEPIRVEPRLLIENTELSNTAADPDTQNMLIHGDNLLALKALESEFAGQVKCIYIDPPYNANAANIYTPNVEFSFDVAIIKKNPNGNYMRLVHNKPWNQYTWNEVPRSHQVKDRADDIKEEGLWQEVRDRYLEKKNMYLFRQDHNHPSFVVYVEAVNEVYSRYFNRGGGYSVQSIF